MAEQKNSGRYFGSVSRRSAAQIERLAGAVREALGHTPDGRISVQPILEWYLDKLVEGAYFEIAEDRALDGAEGRTDALRPVVTLSWSTEAKLKRADPRARMTAAHEIGHLLLHCQQPVFHYRSPPRNRELDPEWQANTFAAALLMPAVGFRKMRSAQQAMRAFGVSRGAAMRRARELNMQFSTSRTHGYEKNRRRSASHTP